MKKITLLLVAFALASCGGKKKTHNDNLGIPDRVEIKGDENYIQFPDSKVFMVMPEDYELNASEGSFYVRKGKQNIGGVKEYNSGIQETEILYEQLLDSIHKEKPYATIKMQDFKLGDYDARYIQIKDYAYGKDVVTLILGNDKQSVTVDAFFPNADGHTEQEIMNILLTTYIDPTTKPEHTPFANYMIDLTGTDYKLNSFTNNNDLLMYVYTYNGFDSKNVVGENFFEIFRPTDSLEGTIDEKKEIVKSILDGIAKDSHVTQEKVITLNNKEAYEIILDKKYEKKNVTLKIYILCVDVGGKTFVLFGNMFKDFEITIATYRHIVETMKLK
jgi:hypothetical protein